MNNEALLSYMSELEHGSWRQFRNAVEELSSSEEEIYAPVMARNLASLGHAEFAESDDLRWRICPPALVSLPPPNTAVAVLCGARTPSLVDSLQRAAVYSDCSLHITRQPDHQAADRISVLARSREALEELGQRTGMTVVENAAGRLASCLPFIDDYWAIHQQAPEPSGHEMEVFDPAALAWVQGNDSSGDGLYRYHIFGRREYRLKAGGKLYGTSREIGVYLALQREGRVAVSYDGAEEQLKVPVRVPLPPLYARAVVFCSGHLPEFRYFDGVPVNCYRETAPGVAQTVLARVRQAGEDI